MKYRNFYYLKGYFNFRITYFIIICIKDPILDLQEWLFGQNCSSIFYIMKNPQWFILFFLQEKMDSMFRKGESTDSWIPVDVSFIKEFWLPDAEILNLKEFKTLDVLSKLEGGWQ